MMKVTKLKDVTRNRYKVYVEERFAFVLYKGELSHFHIKEDSEITEEMYRQIIEDVIVKRGKKRILYLLEKMARTESQIREKMRQNYYTDEVIDEVIRYAQGYGYIDDGNYARMYIADKKRRKSKKEIYYDLIKKGIDKEILQEAMGVYYRDEDSIQVIHDIAMKKGYNEIYNTEKEKQKIFAYLMRKGFAYREICQVLRVSERNA